jgi:hypothetical protein
MNEAQLKDTLRGLAHTVVRNEIVCEHFLTQKLPVTRDEIGQRVREMDAHPLRERPAIEGIVCRIAGWCVSMV